MLEKQLKVLGSGVWGTIGERSVSAAAMLAEYVGAKHGLLCHSAGAAYEAVLRHFGAAGGNIFFCGETCDPMDPLMAVCTGAEPVFVPCSGEVMDAAALDKMLGERNGVRCVTADADPDGAIRKVCLKHRVPLIINAGGVFRKGIVQSADAVVWSLEEGSGIYAGKGGFIAADDTGVYAGAFAYHNCGRGFGEGCSLNMDSIVGGDLRVTEWTAAAVEVVLETGNFSTSAPRKLVRMADQPVFKSEYVKKQTAE